MVRRKLLRRAIAFLAAAIILPTLGILAISGPAGATVGVGLGNQIIGHTVPGHPDFHFNYDYNVSSMQIGNEIKLWWCGGGINPNTPGATGPSDVIYYASYSATSFVPIDPVQVVFGEGVAGTWDDGFTCNPTVITGTFNPQPLTGGPYSYAMYFVGTHTRTTNNDIGVAFSKDGKTWVPYPNPVVNGSCALGVQSPSAVGIDGHQIRLSYIDWCATVVVNNRPAHPIYSAVSPDGVNFATASVISMDGLMLSLPSLGALPTYANLSYDTGTHQWIADVNNGAYRHNANGAEGLPYGFGVYTMPGSGPANLPSGTWTPIHQVDTNLTGDEINAYPATLHDPNGWVHSGINSYPNYLTYYTLNNPSLAYNVTQDAANDGTNLGKWDIGRVALTNDSALITPLDRYTGSGTLLTTAGYLPSGFSAGSAIHEGKLYEAPQPGTMALYNCQLDGTSYAYTTTNISCDGSTDRFIGLQGYVLQASGGAGTLAIFSCRVGSTYFFVSTHPDCEGQTVLGPLGYALPS